MQALGGLCWSTTHGTPLRNKPFDGRVFPFQHHASLEQPIMHAERQPASRQWSHCHALTAIKMRAGYPYACMTIFTSTRTRRSTGCRTGTMTSPNFNPLTCEQHDDLQSQRAALQGASLRPRLCRPLHFHLPSPPATLPLHVPCSSSQRTDLQLDSSLSILLRRCLGCLPIPPSATGLGQQARP